jgi:hypothetical protein
MAKGNKINVNNIEISVITQNKIDLICLTDMTSGFKEGSGLIANGLQTKILLSI